ncbi:MAG: hypothetical protein MRK00_10005 [Nitrosomonas sp.]|nr:hypothetical protein [Nitrosomonas sp.]
MESFFSNDLSNGAAAVGAVSLFAIYALKLLDNKARDNDQARRVIHTYFVVVLLFISIVLGSNVFQPTNSPSLGYKEIALERCNLLEGEYMLMGEGEYLFMDYKSESDDIFDFRAIGKKAFYKTTKCEFNEKTGFATLHGVDESGHDILMKIGSDFIPVTHFTGALESRILINEKGIPFVRYLTISGKYKLFEDEDKKEEFKKDINNYDDIQEKIRKTLERYEALRPTRKTHTGKKECYPAIGRKDKSFFINSFCEGGGIFPTYFRIMRKCESNEADCRSAYVVEIQTK